MKPLLLLILVTLAACNGEPEIRTQVNAGFAVDKLFIYEGCTVYRFRDGGYNRYFTNCKGETFWNQSCGKNCSRGVQIPGGAE